MDLHNLTAYELISEEKIDDINSYGYILKHKKTGARVACISNDDENKVFYIGFRTPPEDSTGVPHIIEHSVLCGSAKYPAKDPFIELAKGSLNTFLNAMTYPDKTVYPVASCNDADFKNLCDVYLDAVFHPCIYDREQIFKQEGWHYEIESADDELSLNGVVYNEMKGAFSSPDDMFDRAIFDSLFPDTCYGVESGGDPDVIPSLTYEAFLDFHKRYYHPSNSYIYLYGNADMEERLKYIDEEYLSKYDALFIDSRVKMQPAFKKVKEVEKKYPVSNDEPIEDNTYISYNAVVEDSLDEKLYIAFQIIEYALLSSPGAVLKQALLDAGICKDVMSTYENGILQPYFSVIIKNSNESDKDKFVGIVEDVLNKVAKDGFDKKALKAGINAFEFKFREADFGHYPKGLMYGLNALDSWLYDDNEPFLHLKALNTFEFLKKNVDTNYFEELVKKYLIDNTHASIVVRVPERGLTVKKDKELADRLSKKKASLSGEDIDKLIKDTKELHAYQEEEDDPEILDMIPLLSIDDIKKEAAPIIVDVKDIENVKYITHDIFTNGIGYLIIAFDISDIDEKLIPYVAILKSCIGFVDTKSHSYADLTNDIYLNTGGMTTTLTVTTDVDKADKYNCLFGIKAKVLYDKVDYAFDMAKELLLTSDFTDKKRIREIICMLKSQLQAGMMSSGHSVATHRAMAKLIKAEDIMEKASGIDFYRVVEDIEANFDERIDELVNILEDLAKRIFTKCKLSFVDYTATAEQYEHIYELGNSFYNALPDIESNFNNYDFKMTTKNEAYKTGAKVCYVAKAGVFSDDAHKYTGALKVLKVIMGYDYLWNQVRVVGGAYGAFATFYRSGIGAFSSYRDPNLSRTLDVYDKAIEYLESFDVSDRDMTKYIIGTIADMDIPLTPSAQGSRGLEVYLTGNSYEKIQKDRDEVLGVTKEDIRALAAYIRNIKDSASICVVGGEEMVENDRELFDNIEPLFMN